MSDTPPAPPAPPATGAPTQPSTPEPLTQPTPPPTAEPTSQGDPAALGDPGKKALDAERDARRAAEAELAKIQARVKEIEDKDKSELEKLAETNQVLATTASDHAKLRAAMAAAPEGTTPQQILGLYSRLQGTTPEELEADAATLFAQFTGQPPAAPKQLTPGLPTEPHLLQPGAPQVGDAPSLQQQIQVAEQAALAGTGDWATVRQLKSQLMVDMQRHQRN